MSHKRMFSKTIIETDAFQDMPQTAQLLYFYFNMQADDDGFVGNPKRIIRSGGFGEDDMKILLAKRFLLTFESGVIVIKHWFIHNTLRKDRYQETSYLKEKNMLQIKENNAYTEQRQPVGNQMVTNGCHSIDIDIDKDIDKEEKKTLKEKTENFIQNVKIVLEGNPNINSNHTEIIKFCSYWTEPNKSGKRLRWELQPTFEIRRRLATWLSNSRDFKGNPKILIIEE